jgi:hypothetical protein
VCHLVRSFVELPIIHDAGSPERIVVAQHRRLPGIPFDPGFD